MSLSTTNSRVDTTGDGILSEFDYTFRIVNKTHLSVIVRNLAGIETVLECDIDYSVAGVGDKNGGSITLLAGPLAEDFHLTILRSLPITQETDIKNQRDFYPAVHEAVWDRITMIEQMLQDQLDRAIKIPRTIDPAQFMTSLPTELLQDHTLILGPNGFSIVLGPTPAQLSAANAASSDAVQAAADAQAAAAAAIAAAEEAAANGGIPPGGLEHAILMKLSATDGDAAWVVPTVSGFSSHYNENVNLVGLSAIHAKAFGITYAGPLISLSASGSGSIREKGTTVSGTTLTAGLTKRSNALAAVRFYQGATLIDTQTTGGGIPNGGNSTFAYAPSFTDNISFSAQVDDIAGGGGPTTATAGASFTFVYPYYVGAGIAALSAANVALLTKLVQVSAATVNRTITVNGSQKMYFAYPASYGALTSILDVNNFDVFPDWTLRTENITGLDGNAVSYRIYEFNNTAVAGDYFFSFRR